jgi:hypothetical protein
MQEGEGFRSGSLFIRVNGNNDCSRTKLLSNGVAHFKFMLRQDLDLIVFCSAVWMSRHSVQSCTFSHFFMSCLPVNVLSLCTHYPTFEQFFLCPGIKIKNQNKKRRQV